MGNVINEYVDNKISALEKSICKVNWFIRLDDEGYIDEFKADLYFENEKYCDRYASRLHPFLVPYDATREGDNCITIFFLKYPLVSDVVSVLKESYFKYEEEYDIWTYSTNVI